VKTPKRKSTRPVIEELEPRILYSADLNPLVIDDGSQAQSAEYRLLNDVTQVALQATHRVNQSELRTHEIAFVDSSVQDYQRFIDDLRAQSGSRDIDVVLLEKGRDGFKQISDVLDNEANVSAIHIISHGSDGSIQLGGSKLDFDSLIGNAAQIKRWGNALSADADILIYGCDVAASQQGQALIDSIGRLTGANVAASDDLTGSSERGGDWELEYRVGHIETLIAISAEVRTDWYSTLATYAVTNTNNSGAGSLRQAIIDANGNAGADSIAFSIALNDSNHLYYRDNGATGFSAPVTTTLADAAITDFDTDYASGTARSWYRISLTGTYLDVTEAVVIDGSTQPGYSAGKGPVIEIDASGITTPSGDRNAIALTSGASTVRGLVINNAGDNAIEVDVGAGGSTLVGNFIGTDVSGTQARGNSTIGSWGAIAIKSNNVVVGGTTAADRNLISGNLGSGIEIYNGATGALIRGNYIGTTVTGAAALSNAAAGIEIHNNAANNTIGGVTAGAGNVIAFNGGDGIAVTSLASGNVIRGNSIHSNTGLGIDLSNDGVTANDTNDTDAGPNALKNFPVLTAASTDGSTVRISGTLHTVANLAHTIDFYASQSGDGSGYGEGAVYLGSTSVTTDASGNASFSNVAFAQAVPVGYVISAVTIDLASGNTSEFSAAIIATNAAPVLDSSKSPVLAAQNEDAAAPVGAVGTLVSALVDYALPAGQVDNVTDPDVGAQLGIAVTAADTTNGSWWYSTDGGANWSALGSPSAASARLLAADSDNRLYFQPNANYNGTLTSAITFRAWDRSSGSDGGVTDTTTNGGNTAFSSATDTASLIVTAVNDAPTIVTAGTTLAYTENAAATAVDGAVTVSDVDSANLASATVTISAGFASGQDTLAFTNQNGISGSWNAGTGVLTLTGSSTLANYQTALRSITYVNTSDNPSTATRTASFVVNDGVTDSNPATRNISVTATNDAPVNNRPPRQYTPFDTNHVFSIASGNSLSITDVDAGSSPIRFRLDSTHGTLALSGTTGLTLVAGADGSNTMTYTGTVGDINAALDGLTFDPTSGYRGRADITITTNDLGNTGSGLVGGDTDTIYVYVGAIVVSNTTDVVNGTTTSISSVIANDGGDGISLREALTATNNTAGTDYIYFDIAGSGVQTINVTSNLPNVTDAVIIDARTQSGYSTSPLVRLDGGNAALDGFRLLGGSSQISGFMLTRFTSNGIDLQSGNNTISANFIGTDGASAFGTGSNGIYIASGATGNLIGGTSASVRNLITSGTQSGVTINGSSNAVQGNWFGVGSDGTTALGNVTQNILLSSGASNNVIGGTLAGAGNRLTNSIRGVSVFNNTTLDNAVLGNSIYGNSGLGIDLGSGGVTANDVGDGDIGPNSLQNFPVLSSANTHAGNTTIVGTINSTANTTLRIEFFSSPAGDVSGNGEGQTYLGFTNVTTNASGDASFAAVLNGVSVTAGHVVSATATVDLGAGSYGSTSEFAQNIAATPIAPGVIITPTSGLITTESGGVAQFDVVLNSAPTADVTITIATSNATEGSVNATLLTFTSFNWNVAQTVTVTGGTDNTVDGNQAYNLITGNTISTDADYNGLVVADVSLTNIDDDRADVLISAPTLGGEFRINTTTVDFQHLDVGTARSVAADANGNYIVVWSSNSQDGGGWGVYAQRIDAAGNALGGEFRVNTTTLGDQVAPTVAMNSSGEFVVAWNGSGAGDSAGIFGQRFDANGNALGSEFQINQTVVGVQNSVNVGIDGAGNFVATWVSAGQDGDGNGVYARRFDASGTALGNEFLVNTFTAGDQQTSLIAMNAVGSFVISWDSVGQDGSDSGIYAQRYDANGIAQGTEFRVNTTTVNEQSVGPAAIDLAGNFVITWVSIGQDGFGRGVYAQRFDANGSAMGTEIRVNTTIGGDQSGPNLAMSPSGEFVIVWNSTSQDGSGSGIYAQRYAANGAAIGSEFRVNSFTAGSQGDPDIAITPAGDFMIVWTGEASGDVDGVFAQRFAATARTTESGGAATFSVVLNSQPTVDVTITLGTSNGAEGSVAPSVTFTAANWNVAQLVTVAGNDDFIDDGDRSYSIVTSASSTDAVYSGISVPDVSVVNVDDDTAGITVTPTTGLVTTEAGTSASFSVVLTSQPTADVVISIATGDASEGSVSVSSLTFTAANWNIAQTVSVTGTQDFLTDGDQIYNVITGIVVSADANYSGFDVSDVTLTNQEVSNAAPVNSVPGTQNVHEDTVLVFSAANGNAISVADVDAGTNLIEVSLSVANGALTLAGTSGLSFTIGDGVADSVMTFRGSVADINAGLSGLTYRSATNFNGSDALDISTNDLGNTGAGGALSDADSIAINVTSVNDAPTGVSWGPVYLSSLTPLTTSNVFGGLTINSGNLNNAITLDGTSYYHGIGMHAPATGVATASYALNGATEFYATVGISDAIVTGGSVTMRAYVDGALVFNSGAITNGSSPLALYVNTVGGATLTLEVDNSNGSRDSDHAVWADARLVGSNYAQTTSTLAEQAVTGSSVGFAVGSDPETGTTFSYSLVDDAGGRFMINTSTGEIIVVDGTRLNYEAAANHNIVVRVSDGALTFDQTMTVALSEINEAPSGANQTISINEGTLYTLAAADFGFSDVDVGNTLSWIRIDSVQTAGSLTLNGLQVSAGQLVTRADIDAGFLVFTPSENTNGTAYASFSFTVEDNRQLMSETSNVITFDVAAVNDAPVLADTPLTLTVAEDGGAPVGAVGSLVSSLISGITDVDTAALKGIAITASNETNGTWYYSTDGGSNWNTVGPVSNAASLLLADDANTRIYFAPASNYNGMSLSALTLRAWDRTTGLAGAKVDSSSNGGTTAFSSATDTVDVTVTAVADTPINVVPGAQSVDEDTLLAISGISVTDPDNNLSTVQVSVDNGMLNVDLVGGASIDVGANNSATLTLAGTQVQINAALATLSYQGNANFNGIDTLTVLSIDTVGATDSDAMTITVNVVNDAPIILVNGGATLNEGAGVTIGSAQLAISDVDNTAAQSIYTVTAIPANGALRLNGIALSVNGTFTQDDVNNSRISYLHDGSETVADRITFTVSDGTGGMIGATNFDLTIGPVNDNSPVITSGGGGASYAISVAENSTSVTTITATDADLPAQTLIYSRVGGTDAARFFIDTNTGLLSFVTAPDFEGPVDSNSDNVYHVTIRVDDGLGGFDEQAISVTVTNINEGGVSPISDSDTTANSVNENAAVGGIVGVTAIAADPDASDAITYTLDNSASGRFVIDANTGLVTIAGALDYESATTHSIVVRATSTDGSSTTRSFLINLLDQNDNAPIIQLGQSFSIVENSANGTNVGVVTATDIDSVGLLQNWTIVGGTGSSAFAIDAATGQITVADLNQLNFETNSSLILQVTVSDGLNVAATQSITINLTNANETPAVTNAIANQVATEDVPFSFQFAANTFNDVDAGDNLTYAASGIPAWLTFDAATRTFSGTPTNADLGVGTIIVRATDLAGVFVEDSFDIVVSNTNDAPTIVNPIGDQNATEDAPFTFQFAANSFADIDAGDSLTYTASGLPPWLSFDAATRTFSGTPAKADIGTVTITVRSTDLSGAFVEDSFDIVVSNTNDAPTIANPISDQNATEDAPFTFQFAANTFADNDAGDSLTYTASGVPAWLTFDATSRSFSGTPGNADVGSLTITVRATDLVGAFSEDQFEIFVANSNDAPVVANSIANQVATEDAVFSFTLPVNTFADVDAGDNLTFTASNVPGWLSFDSATSTFSGTPANGDVGSYLVTVRAIDQSGAFVEDQFDITVSNTNDVPIANDDSFDAFEDTALNGAVGNILSNDSDVENDLLSSILVTGPVHGSVVLNVDGSFVYTPNSNFNGVDSFTYLVSDGIASSNVATVRITVAAINDVPTAEPTGVLGTEDAIYTFTAADFKFADVDGDGFATIRIDSLPGLGQFQLNGRNVALGQTISAAEIGAGALTFAPLNLGNGAPYAVFDYAVSDGAQFSAGQTLRIDIAAVNNAPAIVTNNLSIFAGSVVTLNLANLSAFDPDTLELDLIFQVSSISNGRFELVGKSGQSVNEFSQKQLRAGLVRFVHDGSQSAPNYTLAVSDGVSTSHPSNSIISFFATPITPVINDQPIDPIFTPLPIEQPVPVIGSAPTEEGAAGRDETPVASGDDQTSDSEEGLQGTTDPRNSEGRSVSTAATAKSQRYIQSPRGVEFSAVRPFIGGSWVNDVTIASTTPLRLEFGPAVGDIVIPVSGSFDPRSGISFGADLGNVDANFAELTPEEQRNIQVVLNSTKLSGVALSVGAVWWATRAGGLLASLLATAPAWRSIDPLPIFGTTNDEEDDMYEDRDRDDEAARDDQAVGYLLDDNARLNEPVLDGAR
jgi:Domain of unknown function (DUF4347)/NPCBM/NEW2 domain/Bacterial Ig domain/Cadherin-like/Putative Ig domain/Cadherin domain